MAASETVDPAADPALRWLAAQGLAALRVEPLAGDVSPRRYARVALADGASAILAAYPAEVRDACARFAATTALLAPAGVRVPRILARGCGDGFMLVEDLGPRVLADLSGRPWDELAGYFSDALRQAREIAALDPAAVAAVNPPLDRALLARELQQTWDLFLAPRELLGTPAEAAALRAVLDELLDRLAADPPRPCHRDFMARNLVPLAGPPPRVAVLDHQDLRLGPPAYDLASLLNDTLFPPAEVEAALLAAAAPGAEERLRYHRAAAQRTLKAVGTYASFARRGSDRHLPLIPRTLGRSLAHLERTPEGEALVPLLARLWRPALTALPH
jgi:N-acetylmuramate 1-kinase